MFGKRKGPTSPSEPAAPRQPETAPGGSSAAGPAGTSAAATPAKPAAAASPASPPLANPAPVPQTGGSAKPRRAEGRLASAVEGRKLVVGREICLSGEIKTCEKLVVEGQVEADLRDSHSLEISEPGLFKGHATVEDCEVSGTFEGELIVTGLLVITPTGRVSGKIRYADMEIARGARLSGDIDALDEATLRRLRGDGPKLAHDNGKSRIG